MPRVPRTMSFNRVAVTPRCLASWFTLMSSGLRISSEMVSPGCGGGIWRGIGSPLMVIGNLDCKRIALVPGKADPVSVVNPDAVLPFAFLGQQLQVVAGDCGQIARARCLVQMDQFAQGNLFDGLK